MGLTQFDQYAKDYVAAVDDAAGVSVEQLAGEKARLILEALGASSGDRQHVLVLDLGCGIGLLDRELEPHVGALIGVDVSLPSLQLAAGRAPATAFAQYDGARLPFADRTFGCAVASCVLHHVMPPARACFIGEMMRVLTPGGLAVIIEHNARNPVTRHIVSRCAFDADAVLLTRQETATLLADGGVPVAGWRYLGFLPFRNRIVERAERLVGWLPAGAQYCVWGRKCTNV